MNWYKNLFNKHKNKWVELNDRWVSLKSLDTSKYKEACDNDLNIIELPTYMYGYTYSKKFVVGEVLCTVKVCHDFLRIEPHAELQKGGLSLSHHFWDGLLMVHFYNVLTNTSAIKDILSYEYITINDAKLLKKTFESQVLEQYKEGYTQWIQDNAQGFVDYSGDVNIKFSFSKK